MFTRKPLVAVVGLPLAILLVAAGCESPKPPAPKPAASPAPADAHGHEHDHGDHAHPATLAEGLEQLQKGVTTISTNLATGSKDAADDAVHEVGHLLEDLEQLVEKQEWTAEIKATGRKALAELTESFDKVDQALHAAEGEGESALNVLGSVTERIGMAIVSLGDLIKSDTPSVDKTTKEAN